MFEMIELSSPVYQNQVQIALSKLYFGNQVFFFFFCQNLHVIIPWKKVQVGNDQDKAQSEKDSHCKKRGAKI